MMNKKKSNDFLWLVGLALLIALCLILVTTVSAASENEVLNFRGTWKLMYSQPNVPDCSVTVNIKVMEDGNVLAELNGFQSVAYPVITEVVEGGPGPWKLYSFKVFEMVFKFLYHDSTQSNYSGVGYITTDLPYGGPTVPVNFVLTRME
jgi:hypothetical protein